MLKKIFILIYFIGKYNCSVNYDRNYIYLIVHTRKINLSKTIYNSVDMIVTDNNNSGTTIAIRSRNYLLKFIIFFYYRQIKLKSVKYFNEEELISVIITTYNRKEQLEYAIKSVLNQTYKNLEVIIVNDGGCDVRALINAFDDYRIKYFKIPHQGKAPALNFAIRKCKGKYIAYLDDDDIYYSNHIEILYSYLKLNNAKYAFSIAEENVEIEHNGSWKSKKLFLRFFKPANPIMLRHYNNIPNLTVLHSKELFKITGLYDENLSVLIDWDMYRRLSLVATPYFINYKTSQYVRRLKKNKYVASQITGIYFNNPVKFYQNRLLILRKPYKLNLIKKSDRVCFILDYTGYYLFSEYQKIIDHIKRKWDANIVVFFDSDVNDKNIEDIIRFDKMNIYIYQINKQESYYNNIMEFLEYSFHNYHFIVSKTTQLKDVDIYKNKHICDLTNKYLTGC